MTEPLIRNISDTARWAAVFRAQETERPDALFRDPLARRLAGERGQQIATAMTMHTKNAWSWVMRTYVVDQYIERMLAVGVDTVLNLAAGLDTRPYRMGVPFKFGPPEGPDIFRRWGWRPLEVRSTFKAAHHAGRLPWPLKLFGFFPESNGAQGKRPWGGLCLLERAE